MGSVQLAIAQSAPAATNDGLEEVIVTAQRRTEDLHNVPVAVTAVSAEDLAASNVKTVQDLATVVSGFVGPGNNGMQSPHLRGIGTQVASPGLENSVALYVDGVYIGATAPALLALNFVDQVEVLKGPQGTLFGRNTTGGLVQVSTRNPGDTPSAEIELGYANYQKSTGAFYGSTPIGSNVSTNIAVQIGHQGEGWGKNLFNGQDVYKTDQNVTLRNKWKIRFGDATDLLLIGDYEKVKEIGTFAYRPVTGSWVNAGGTPYHSLVSGWDVNTNVDQTNNTEAYGFSGRLSHDFGFATLSDTLAYRHTKWDLLGFDGDRTPLSTFGIYWHTHNKQVTNELQLASNGTGDLSWTTGLFYYHAVDDTFQPLIFGALGPQFPIGPLQSVTLTDTLTNESVAAYGQMTYKFTPTTSLTAGLRYSEDKHHIAGYNVMVAGGTTYLPGTTLFGPVSNPPPTDKSVSKNSEAWRLALSHEFSPDTMGYVSYNHGVKTGGFNPVVVTDPAYEDEKLDTFEAGTKLNFLDNHARLNLAAFYNNYKNIQVQKFNVSGPPSTYNGPSAKSYGLDVDFEVRPVTDLTIRATAEVLHTAYGDFPGADLLVLNNTPVDLVPGPGGYKPNPNLHNAQGNALGFAPKFTASVAPTYTIPTSYGSYDLSATWSYNSGFTTTPGEEVPQGAYSMVGANVQFNSSGDRFFVRLWGSNLANTEAAMQLGVSATGNSIGLLAPRTFGLTVGAKFK